MAQEQVLEGDVEITGDLTVLGKLNDTEITEIKTKLETTEVVANLLDAKNTMNAPSDANLVMHLSLDDEVGGDGDVITDSSGSDHDATITGTPSWVIGKNGGALDLDNASQEFLTVAHHADFNFGTGDFSISMWCKPDNLSTLQYLLRKYGAAYNRSGFTIRIAADDKVNVTACDADEEILAESDSALSTGTWYHIVMVVDRGADTLTLYIDSIPQVDIPAVTTLGTIDASNDLVIGTNTAGVSQYGGNIDEIRIYSVALIREEVNFLYRIPGGPTQSVVTNDRLAALSITNEKIGLLEIEDGRIATASLTARALTFGGDVALITNTEEIDRDTQELFSLDFPCRSSDGRAPAQKIIVPNPAIIYDHANAEYTNPRARTWSGLTGTPATNTVGIWKGATNDLLDPEDLTTSNWASAGTIAVALSDRYFDNKRFTLITSTTNSAERYQAFTFSGSNSVKSFQFILKKETEETDTAVYVYDTIAPAVRCFVTINWTTQVVAASTGALVDVEWFGTTTMVRITAVTTSVTVANNHYVAIRPSNAGQGAVYATALMTEDSIYPTPYTPSERPAGMLRYKYEYSQTGAIEFRCRPRFDQDTAGTHYLFGNYDSTHNLYCIYNAGTDQFNFTITGATTTVTLTAGNAAGAWSDSNTFSGNTYLHTWMHFKIVWDVGNDNYYLYVNGVLIDSDEATDIGVWTPSHNILNIGCAGAYGVQEFDGEITDLLIWNSADVTTAHYTSAKPWKDPNTIPNYDSSVTISRHGIGLHKADISMLDKVGRSLDIGSEGLLVRDAGFNIIHDIPDAPLFTNHIYCGHDYWYEDLSTYELIDSTSSTLSAWTDLPCIVRGMTNPKLAKLRVFIQHISTGATDTSTMYVYFRPKGSSWGISLDSNTPAIYEDIQTSGPYLKRRRVVALCECPLGTSNTIQYYLYISPTGVGWNHRFIVMQLGVQA